MVIKTCGKKDNSVIEINLKGKFCITATNINPDFYVKNLPKYQYPTSRNFRENKIWRFILKIEYRIVVRPNFSNLYQLYSLSSTFQVQKNQEIFSQKSGGYQEISSIKSNDFKQDYK